MSIHYIARRPLKVGDRMVDEGEIVLEAATWRDVQTYVANGSLAVGVDVAPEAVEKAELKGRVATLEVRVAALEAFIAGTGQDLTVETITDIEVEVELIDGHFDADDLRTWTREQLDGVAAGQGIENPGELETEELIARLVEIPVQVPVTDEPAAQVDLSGWKLADLLALAARAGIPDPQFTRKVDAIASIEAKTSPEQLADLVAASRGDGS